MCIYIYIYEYIYMYEFLLCYCYNIIRYNIVIITDVRIENKNVPDECASPYYDAYGIS